ncbi:uncharacterized protein JN550_002904 [Neoarthrinium moseri]|uniref:uncharacterized protein n=1 Tax=Neoarthrinium moseri TaxID=1658444 RepID=UPI001FDE8BF7|nr:uncharacterized protein JN550_002904 [Neoarthrinium moseri]KAI1874325.1 hypothetical protein JN550_002904 [Neoarthrinium moseri]
MTGNKQRPPFRAEHLGSLLRPKELTEKRVKLDSAKALEIAQDKELHAIEDKAINKIVKSQLDLGFHAITDGEYRRHQFWGTFFPNLQGFEEISNPSWDMFRLYVPDTAAFTETGHKPGESIVCTGKIKHVGSSYIHDWDYLKKLVPADRVKELKITLAAPEWYHLRYKKGYAYPKDVYANDAEYFADIAVAYKAELQTLYDAGCRNVTIDDPNLAYFCSEKMLAGFKDDGEDSDALLDSYIKLYNDCISSRPADLHLGIHLCRGNFAYSKHFSEGGYDRIATKLFNDINADTYFLEYDTERAGTFAPLKELPPHKNVVLGVITSKFPELENIDELKSRVFQAADIIAKGAGQTREEALKRIGPPAASLPGPAHAGPAPERDTTQNTCPLPRFSEQAFPAFEHQVQYETTAQLPIACLVCLAMPEKSKPPPDESVTYSSGKHDGPPDLRILHYNDVYHVDSSSAEPVGGVARFMSLVKHYREDPKWKGQPDLVTLFSGDAFNPSLESSITKGAHMVPLLNNIGTDAAALGNHDLDFGVRQFRNLASKCKFPWLIANVLDPALGESVPIGNAKKTHMITTSNGVKVGLIGLGEREWLATINSLPPDLIYKSASETARELVPKLRAEGAEIVIAVTHMREPNDNKLAEQTDGIIDIILGGHDHYYNHSFIKGTHVLRSGTDFKQLSYIEARRAGNGSRKWDIDIIRRDVTSAIPQHDETVKLVEKLTASLKSTLQKPIGYTAAPLDARFRTVRLKESNIANWVCDIMRHHYSGECCIMASGTIRGDQIYPPGPILLKDIMNCFPFEDPVVVIKVTGQAIWDALENGVSQYPALEGRFPQVSNIKFTFDANKAVGSRILKATIGDEPIDMEKMYTLVTRGYMARGKDGFDSLLIEEEGGKAKEIVSEENGILISMMLRQYFMSLRVMGQWKNWGNAINRHWNEVSKKVSACHPHFQPTPQATPTSPSASKSHGWDNWTPQKVRSRRGSVLPREEESDSEDEGTHEAEKDVEGVDKELQIMRRVFGKWAKIAGVECKVADELNQNEFDVDWTTPIAPRVEGRITQIGGDPPN